LLLQLHSDPQAYVDVEANTDDVNELKLEEFTPRPTAEEKKIKEQDQTRRRNTKAKDAGNTTCVVCKTDLSRTETLQVHLFQRHTQKVARSATATMDDDCWYRIVCPAESSSNSAAAAAAAPAAPDALALLVAQFTAVKFNLTAGKDDAGRDDGHHYVDLSLKQPAYAKLMEAIAAKERKSLKKKNKQGNIGPCDFNTGCP
jgi:hypothetical protein